MNQLQTFLAFLAVLAVAVVLYIIGESTGAAMALTAALTLLVPSGVIRTGGIDPKV